MRFRDVNSAVLSAKSVSDVIHGNGSDKARLRLINNMPLRERKQFFRDVNNLIFFARSAAMELGETNIAITGTSE